MVKQLINPSNKKTIKQLEKAICKHKTLNANLNQFVKKLHRKHQHLTTKEYLIRIHNYIHNFKAVAKRSEDASKPAYKFGRVCKKCGDWKDRQKMVECRYCQDYYHLTCQTDKNVDRNEWYCKMCTDIQCSVNRENSLKRHYGKAQQSSSINKCNKCKDNLSSKVASCMKCGFHYHSKCFGKENSNVIVCENCHFQIEEQIKTRKSLVQKTLYDYFDAKNTDQWSKMMQKSQASTIHDQLTITYCSSLSLKPPIKLTKQQLDYYKKDLLYAIYSKKMEYSEQLVFENKIPEDIYYQDPSIQYIDKKDQKAYITYKNQPIGPYKLILIEGMGYDVKADKDIPKGTIICQYIGQVITKRQALGVENDSLMDLMLGMDADSSLVIKPQKYTNMARFINGVNNLDPVLSKKANVRSIKIGICGRPTILLYAMKKINKGDSLLYNYNGGLDFYDTQGFI